MMKKMDKNMTLADITREAELGDRFRRTVWINDATFDPVTKDLVWVKTHSFVGLSPGDILALDWEFTHKKRKEPLTAEFWAAVLDYEGQELLALGSASETAKVARLKGQEYYNLPTVRVTRFQAVEVIDE
jgi:hypothetical protein